jgi:hypothetical protein
MIGSHERHFAAPSWVTDRESFEVSAHAHFFFDDAESMGQRGSSGQFFLYVHAIELALKGFLLAKGMNEKDLITHDLEALVQWCLEKGMEQLSRPYLDVIAGLNKASYKARLRYKVNFEVPSLVAVNATAKRILKLTEPKRPDGSD